MPNHENAVPQEATDVEITPELLARLARITSGTLTTELYRAGFRQPVMIGLKPLNPRLPPFAGEAYTMRFIPAREDRDTYATLTTEPNPDNLQWVGVEEVGAGQVLVIDSRGSIDAASAGNILLTRLWRRGAAGVVTDGAFRDGSEIASMQIPAYCQGITATTRLACHHVADLQTPIACAGIAVYPGDIIVGDADGITVVPRAVAPRIVDACERRDALESYLADRIAQGEPLWGVYPPSEATRAEFEASNADQTAEARRSGEAA